MLRAFREPRWRSRLGTLALEVFSVVLAVLLALAANDWRDARAAAALTRRSVASIAEELGGNLELLREAHAHHRAVLETIRESLPETGELPEPEARELLAELYRTGIIRPAPVVDTAWSTARISGAVQGLDYGVALRVSRVYAFQDDYEMATQATNNAMNLAQFLGAEPGDFLAGVHEGVTVHWWLEERLLSAYREALAAIRESPAAD